VGGFETRTVRLSLSLGQRYENARGNNKGYGDRINCGMKAIGSHPTSRCNSKQRKDVRVCEGTKININIGGSNEVLVRT
jgi:hypothetical protein